MSYDKEESCWQDRESSSEDRDESCWQDINEDVDRLIRSQVKKPDDDELVSEIHPDIFFRRNSVNLVVAKRGSGKTFTVLRELLKCMMLGHDEYTQLYYVSDKENDDTVSKLQPLLERYIDFIWIETKDALTLFKAIEFGKANLDEPEFRESFKAESLPHNKTPHTFILFDDCIGLFNKTTDLARKLYQNRQSRITAFLMLQDVNGLSASMKANIDSLVLFGGFPKHKYQVLVYQMPPIDDFTYEDYSELSPQDCVIIDFASGTYELRYRK